MSEANIIPRTMALAPRTFEEAKDQASALSKAEGFVNPKALGKPAAVLAALMTGAELGIGPMEALRSIHVIEGKPTLSAEFMLTRAIRAGVKHQWLSLSATEARIKLMRPGWEPMTLSFTMDEAEAAGVTRKDNWRKYPAAMLRARCISAAIRAYCPDVLGAGLYTPEELGAETDETGDPIVVERAPLRAVDASPRGEASAQGEPEAGANDCGGSCGDKPDEHKHAPPTQLRECKSIDDLRGWIAMHWPTVYGANGPKAAEHVVKHARKIGADPADVDAWLGVATPAGTEEPAAAE